MLLFRPDIENSKFPKLKYTERNFSVLKYIFPEMIFLKQLIYFKSRLNTYSKKENGNPFLGS